MTRIFVMFVVVAVLTRANSAEAELVDGLVGYYEFNSGSELANSGSGGGRW